MNHAVVQVGGNYFVCPSVAVGAKIVELLGKCAQVEHDYVRDEHGHHRAIFTTLDPSADRIAPVEFQIVPSGRIEKPKARVPKSRQLGFTEPLSPPTV